MHVHQVPFRRFAVFLVFAADVAGTLAYLGDLVAQLGNLDDFLDFAEPILPVAVVEPGQRTVKIEVIQVPEPVGATAAATVVAVAVRATVGQVIRVKRLPTAALSCLRIVLVVGTLPLALTRSVLLFLLRLASALALLILLLFSVLLCA